MRGPQSVLPMWASEHLGLHWKFGSWKKPADRKGPQFNSGDIKRCVSAAHKSTPTRTPTQAVYVATEAGEKSKNAGNAANTTPRKGFGSRRSHVRIMSPRLRKTLVKPSSVHQRFFVGGASSCASLSLRRLPVPSARDTHVRRRLPSQSIACHHFACHRFACHRFGSQEHGGQIDGAATRPRCMTTVS